MKAPGHLGHKPIIAVNEYEKIDAKYANNTDARALSIGKAQYDAKELSVKVWRHTGEQWSRQSEEMPIHRALDLGILSIAAIITDPKANYPLTSLREEIMDKEKVEDIKDYYRKNEKMLLPRLEELHKVLSSFFEKKK
ncbi:DUF6530 family protein [Xanthovirga aplysinae]|uniref:DUF6530 family protein n=1 Tax=Xanthovirga aplysinae TaxID=2529853 RepID=UPI0012BBB506|nr:DUF6530 family protein [Xanthovirga aplysinae]MTI29337.1 hypothetical protein [Xanthovirga aplysinae]